MGFHTEIWNFVLEISSVAAAGIVVYGIVAGASVVCWKIGRVMGDITHHDKDRLN